jgi:hypothetical protein
MYKLMAFELSIAEVEEWGKTFYEERYDLKLF